MAWKPMTFDDVPTVKGSEEPNGREDLRTEETIEEKVRRLMGLG